MLLEESTNEQTVRFRATQWAGVGHFSAYWTYPHYWWWLYPRAKRNQRYVTWCSIAVNSWSNHSTDFWSSIDFLKGYQTFKASYVHNYGICYGRVLSQINPLLIQPIMKSLVLVQYMYLNTTVSQLTHFTTVLTSSQKLRSPFLIEPTRNNKHWWP